MAMMTIELDNKVKGTLRNNSLRLYDEETAEEKVIQIPSKYKVVTSIEERKKYRIYIPKSKPKSIPKGYGNLRIGNNGYYIVDNISNCVKEKQEMVYIVTKDLKKEDFDTIPSILGEIINHIPKDGFWVDVYPQWLRDYFQGEKIISKCKNFDVANKTRLINVYEFLYSVLNDKKETLAFDRDVFDTRKTNWIIPKKVLCSISSAVFFENWDYMVEDSNSPTGYSIISLNMLDRYDLTRLNYRYCNEDDLFSYDGVFRKLYAIAYEDTNVTFK